MVRTVGASLGALSSRLQAGKATPNSSSVDESSLPGPDTAPRSDCQRTTSPLVLRHRQSPGGCPPIVAPKGLARRRPPGPEKLPPAAAADRGLTRSGARGPRLEPSPPRQSGAVLRGRHRHLRDAAGNRRPPTRQTSPLNCRAQLASASGTRSPALSLR